jgi:hypothetical protein
VLGTGGTLVSATGVITYTSGTFSCATVSALTWASGANYYHNVSGTTASGHTRIYLVYRINLQHYRHECG